MATTLKDLARYTGYSVGTISNYITGRTNVSPEKQKHIEHAINTLNYKVNFAARMLKTNEYKSIGILIPDFKNIFLVNVVSYMELRLADSGYDMVVLSYNNDPYKEKNLLNYLSQRVDGILYVPTLKGLGELIAQLQRNTPIVTFDEVNEDILCDHVISDNINISEKAIETLIKKGHSKIGMISGPFTAFTPQQRKQGYLNIMAKYNKPVLEGYILAGDYSKTSGCILCEKMVDSNPEITAIFVAGYRMTLGVIAQLKKRKLDKKISIIGCDLIDLQDVISPPAGYIYQSHSEIADNAVNLILRRINKDYEDFPKSIRTRAELRNINKLPFVHTGNTNQHQLFQLPHLIELNRNKGPFPGGKSLDEWQRLDQVFDHNRAEETLFSLNMCSNASNTMLPDGSLVSIGELVASNCSSFFGDVCDSVSTFEFCAFARDILSREHISYFNNTGDPYFFSKRNRLIYILKSRSVNGEESCLYAGLKRSFTVDEWVALDSDKKLEAMHKIATREGDMFCIPPDMPYCIGGGNVIIGFYGSTYEEIDIESTQNIHAKILSQQSADKLTVTPFSIIKTPIVSCEIISSYQQYEQFKVEKYRFSQPVTLPNYNVARVMITIKGSCDLAADDFVVEAEQGRGVFLPKNIEELQLSPTEGESIALVCYLN